MATFIETDSIAPGGATTPTNAGSIIRDSQWGIDATLSGYIIQNVTVGHTRTYDTTQDQKGATVSELDYDEQWDLNMTVIGGDGNEQGNIPGLSVGMTDFTWDNQKWKIRGVTFTGTYNDKKSYQIEAIRFKNFPANA